MTISLGTATSTSVATSTGATSTAAASKLGDLCLIYLFNEGLASVPIISFTSNNFREVYFRETSVIRQ
jgi:hypothetical protein